MPKLTINLTQEEYDRVKDHPERVEMFLGYSPGSPTQPPLKRGIGNVPRSFGDAANC